MPDHDVDSKAVAAKRHADANKSDPFAYGRMLTHLRLGLAELQEVEADARALVLHGNTAAATSKANDAD